MAEKIGLIAVLDLTEFNRSYNAYKKALGEMNTMTGNTANSLDQSFLGFGNSLNKLALILGTVVVAAAGAAAVAITKMTIDAISQAADLEQQISNIAAVLNMTNEEASFLKDVIIDLGLDPTLRVTTFEAAQAIELLAKNGIFAGMSLEDTERAAMDAARATIFLANATGAEFGQAANIATSAMTLFGLEASQLIDIVSNITAVTTNSKFTIDDYELALRNGGAAAATFGVSLTDFNTVVAATADELGTGMRDGTSFANMLYRLTPNSNKAADAMRELGLITANGSNVFFDTAGNLKSVNDISKILYDTLYGSSTVMVEVNGRTAEQNALLLDLHTEYKKAEQTIADYTTGVVGMLASEEEKNKAIEEAQAIMATLAPEIANLEGIQGDYIESTKQLTAEQRMLAIETIFGRDALGAVIGLMKEGAPVVGDVTRVMDALAISEEEAFALVSSGITEFELLQKTMARTDAEENAKTRMDNLKGSLEILGGVIEAIKIELGDRFLPILNDIVKSVTEWVNNSKPLQDQLIGIADGVAKFIEAIYKGEGQMEAFVSLLENIGGEDLSSKFDSLVTSITNFVTPIVTFVTEHSDAFIAALQAIGLALLGMMVASAVAGVLSLLLSPVTALIALVGTLGFAWSENWLGIRDTIDTVKGKIDEFSEKVTGIKDFKITGFDSLQTVISATIASFPELLSSIDWSGLYQGLLNSAATLGTTLGQMFTDVDWSSIAETLITGLANAVIGVVGLLTVVGTTIITFLGNFFGSVDWSTVATSIITGIQNGLSNVGDLLAPLQKGFEEFDLSKVFYKIFAFFAAMKGLSPREILIAFSSLKEKLEPITDIFTAWYNTVMPSLKNSWADIVVSVENRFLPIWETLKLAFQDIIPFLELLGVVFGTVFTSVLGIFTSVITGIIGGLNTFLSGLGWVVDGVIKIFSGITVILGGIWDIIAGIFTGNGERIGEGFKNLFTGVWRILEGIVQTILGVIQGTLGTIIDIVWTFVLDVFSFFTNLYEELVGHSIIPDMVRSILEWILSLRDQFLEFISSLVLNTLIKIGTFVLNMVAKIIELKDSIINKVRDLWKEFINLVTDKTLEILTKIGEFVLDMVDKITEAKDKFFGAGQNIMDGLIDGIKDKLIAAIAAIRDFGQDILDAWNDFWNTHSPSKLMMESAKNIMSGFNLGVKAEVTPSTNIMQNAADSIFSGYLGRANSLLPRGDFRNPVQNVDNSRTNHIQLNNNFSGNPQITDVNQLQLMLAGYV